MNIENLTIAEVRQITALAASLTGSPTAAPGSPFIGKHVICRCYSAGVHAGVLVSMQGDTAVLSDSVRLWQWHANDGIALSGVAVHGLNRSKSKLDTGLPSIQLTGVIEVIPTSEKARETIHG